MTTRQATLRTLINRADEGDNSSRAQALRDAGKRVRVRTIGRQLIASIDGIDAYRTNDSGEGLWHQIQGAEWRESDDTRRPVYAWRQILGTTQISGRSEVRSWVVENVADHSV